MLRTKKVWALGLFLAAAAIAVVCLPGMSAANGGVHTLRFDVAMDGWSFSMQGELNENGAPAKGTPFIIEGYIYPGHVFDQHGKLSGVNPDGSPEFPELVIGKWTCRGWHLLDGDASTGAVVATTQTFDFDMDNPGAQMIASEGIELADWELPFKRVISGGTGGFRGLTGQHEQTYVGGDLNASGGFNTSFKFQVLDGMGY